MPGRDLMTITPTRRRLSSPLTLKLKTKRRNANTIQIYIYLLLLTTFFIPPSHCVSITLYLNISSYIRMFNSVRAN